MTKLTPEEMATLNQALAVAESEYRRCEDGADRPGLLRDKYRQRALDVRVLRKKIIDTVLAML